MFFFLLVAACLRANAQDPTAVALSQAQAVREFPALVRPDSNFNRRYIERLHSLKMANDSLLLRDDWPEVLAREIGIEVDIAPISEVPAATPTPGPTPWTSFGTMLDSRPEDSPAPVTVLDPGATVQKFFVGGRVILQTPSGLLVLCERIDGIGYEAATGEVWLTGIDAAAGKIIKTAAVRQGAYTYTAPDGIQSVYDKYQAQQ